MEDCKKFAISVLMAIAISVIAVFLICSLPDIKDCGPFSLQTYTDELQTPGFMSDKKFDIITNYHEAAKCGTEILKDDYSLSLRRHNKYSVEVYFDSEADAWLVYYTLKSIYVYNELSADYYVILSVDGDVMARWGVK